MQPTNSTQAHIQNLSAEFVDWQKSSGRGTYLHLAKMSLKKFHFLNTEINCHLKSKMLARLCSKIWREVRKNTWNLEALELRWDQTKQAERIIMQEGRSCGNGIDKVNIFHDSLWFVRTVTVQFTFIPSQIEKKTTWWPHHISWPTFLGPRGPHGIPLSVS